MGDRTRAGRSGNTGSGHTGPGAGERRTWARLPRQRVLVVEADASLRDLLTRALREEGFGAVDAPDEAAALAEMVRQALTTISKGY